MAFRAAWRPFSYFGAVVSRSGYVFSVVRSAVRDLDDGREVAKRDIASAAMYGALAYLDDIISAFDRFEVFFSDSDFTSVLGGVNRGAYSLFTEVRPRLLFKVE